MKTIAGVRGAYKMLGKERGNKIAYLDGFGFILKQPERPHPKLVHWWLLVHSSPFSQQGQIYSDPPLQFMQRLKPIVNSRWD
jgi:hypothetical protein